MIRSRLKIRAISNWALMIRLMMLSRIVRSGFMLSSRRVYPLLAARRKISKNRLCLWSLFLLFRSFSQFKSLFQLSTVSQSSLQMSPWTFQSSIRQIGPSRASPKATRRTKSGQLCAPRSERPNSNLNRSRM